MRKRKNRYGLSLVELIVAFAIIVIIFAAVVPQFRAIRKSWSSTEARAEIIQNGRVLAEHITRNLAAAKQIVRVSPSGTTTGFIVFKDNNDIQKCYMFSDRYVVFGVVDSEEQLAGPVDRFQISCWDVNDFNNPTIDGNDIRFVQIETDFSNADVPGADRTFSSEVFIQANVPQDQNTIDIMVKSAQPNTVFDYNAGDEGCNAVIDVSGSVVHGLLCFKNIVGTGAGQVPQGTQITEAKLRLWYVNDNSNANVYFYRMTVPWDENSTWNSIGGGVQPGVNCANSVTRYLGTTHPADVNVDVTNIVQSWINGNYPNYGFGIINSSSNNLQFAAAENTTGTGAHTPKLEIIRDPGVAMKTMVMFLGANATFDSYRSSLGAYGGNNVSSNALVAVDAIGNSRIRLLIGARINGDAYIGSGGDPNVGISATGGSVITGTRGVLPVPIVFPNRSDPTNVGPSLGDFTPSTSYVITSNKHYNNMTLGYMPGLVIVGNITILADANFSTSTAGNSQIIITPNSTLDLYVKGICTINNGAKLNSLSPKSPSVLRIYMLGSSKTFTMSGTGTEMYGMLENTNGTITVSTPAQFYGRMKGWALTGTGKVHVDLDSSMIGSQYPWWTIGGETIPILP